MLMEKMSISINMIKSEVLGYLLEFLKIIDLVELYKIKNKKLNGLILNHFSISYSKRHFKTNPQNFIFIKSISQYSGIVTSNIFDIYTDKPSQTILVIPTKDKHIKLINLFENTQINLLKGHNSVISCLKYFKEESGKQWLISSSFNGRILLWDLDDYSLFLTIETGSYDLYSCTSNNIKGKNYIISSYFNEINIKVFNFTGEFLFEFCINYVNTVELWHDYFSDKYYILSLSKNIKLVDFFEKELIVFDENSDSIKNSCVIENVEMITYLFVTGFDNIIKIWELHTGKLIKKYILNCILFGIVIWNTEYIVCTGYNDGNLIVINIINDKILFLPQKHKQFLGTIKKVSNNEKGEFLITGGSNDPISLWG